MKSDRSNFLKIKPKTYSKGVLQGNYAYENLAEQEKEKEKKNSQQFVSETQASLAQAIKLKTEKEKKKSKKSINFAAIFKKRMQSESRKSMENFGTKTPAELRAIAEEFEKECKNRKIEKPKAQNKDKTKTGFYISSYELTYKYHIKPQLQKKSKIVKKVIENKKTDESKHQELMSITNQNSKSRKKKWYKNQESKENVFVQPRTYGNSKKKVKEEEKPQFFASLAKNSVFKPKKALAPVQGK